jgi:hypothetical protein
MTVSKGLATARAERVTRVPRRDTTRSPGHNSPRKVPAKRASVPCAATFE